MLELSINGAVPESLYYDEIIILDVAYAGETPANVTVQANVHGKSLDGTDVAVPLYEHEHMLKSETKQVEIHLKFANQSLSDLKVEFSAVAVVPEAPPAAASGLETKQSGGQLLEFKIMDLTGPDHTPLDQTATEPVAVPHLGHEIACASIGAALVPCLDISVHYVRTGLEKDSALCQFDFQSFKAELNITELEFKLHQGRITPLVPVSLPLAIRPSSVYAFAMRIDTLLSTSSATAQVNIAYTSNNRSIKSQWTSRLALAESQGPVPKTPQVPQVLPPSKRNSALSQQSLASLSSQTAVYPSSLAPTTSVRSALAGVSIYVSGPNKVKRGEEFDWQVTFVNKTNRTRKLGLFMHSKESTVPSLSRHEERALVSDVYTLLKRIQVYRSTIGDVMGVIPLVPSVRIGQLGPYSSFNATVRFLANEPGLHSVTGSTIQDLSTGEVYETGPLLQVMVE